MLLPGSQLMGGERMVECMVSSDVGRYLEFKGIDNIYLLLRDDNKNPIWEVSCSKVCNGPFPFSWSTIS